jgi:hypothetical protein
MVPGRAIGHGLIVTVGIATLVGAVLVGALPSSPLVFQPPANAVVLSQGSPPALVCAAQAATLLRPAALGPWRSRVETALSRPSPPLLGFDVNGGTAPWRWWRSQTIALLNLPRNFDSLNPDRMARQYPDQVFQFTETLNELRPQFVQPHGRVRAAHRHDAGRGDPGRRRGAASTLSCWPPSSPCSSGGLMIG